MKTKDAILEKAIIDSGFDYNQKVKYCGPNVVYTGQIGRIHDFAIILEKLYVMVDWEDGETRNVSINSIK